MKVRNEWDREFERLFNDWGPPTANEIAEENEMMLRRQREFRLAAEYVAAAFAEFEAVRKVVLLGSVARPLKKEIPRFKKYRRARQAIFHECKDVDLAVWLADLSLLKQLQRAKGRALNRLFEEREIGVAHHQVDVFLMEPGADRYLGRLCTFGECPKGKPECYVKDCGATLFLRQHEDFIFKQQALSPAASVALFDREAHSG